MGPMQRVVDRPQSRRCRPDSALDLVHLTHQCQGDAQLKNELLALFRRQAQDLTSQLSATSAASSLELKADIAHKLRGSASAVGAGRVAEAAGALEEQARAASTQACVSAEHVEAMSRALAALEAAVAEVVAEIALIRS